MNLHNFNAANFGAADIDSAQRANVTFAAAAVFRPFARVRRRAPVVVRPSSHIYTAGRCLVRGGVVTFAQTAALHMLGWQRTRTFLKIHAEAVFTPGGLVIPRRMVPQGRLVAAPMCAISINPKVLRPSGLIQINAFGMFLPAAAQSYERYRACINFSMQARIDANGETVKQIPYDEDAPDVRVMVVPYQAREMRVA